MPTSSGNERVEPAVAGERNLLGWLRAKRLVVADGAMGTMLVAAGLGSGECPELWNVTRPDAVRDVMRCYREAGAELLETNSFGGSPAKLACYGLGDQCEELNRAAARIGREAAGDEALVLGSMGPTGHLLEPLGPLSASEAFEGFRVQAEALAAGGADALCVETMIDLGEAQAAVRAAVATGLPVVATMTFESTRRGFFTVMGVSVEQAARALEEVGAKAIGANCGTGSAPMLLLAAELGKQSKLPLVFQPNAGLPQICGSEVRYPEAPETMASLVAQFAAAGAAIIGGCCGSTPGHIRAIARAADQVRRGG